VHLDLLDPGDYNGVSTFRLETVTMDFNAMSTNSGATVIGGWGSLESFMPQLPGSVDHEHPNASDLHVHPDRTIEPGISYSRKLCPDSSCDTDREASVQALKTFTSNKPADIRVQLQSHFDKFEPTHPGIMMMILLLFLQKQNLASAVYLFGLGARLSGPGLNTCDNALTVTLLVHW
jgi:hypothetical protein